MRLREEFSRQASAMEKLASEALRAAGERDKAWADLGKARAMLAGEGGGSGGRSGGLRASNGLDSLDRFAVETHLVGRAWWWRRSCRVVG